MEGGKNSQFLQLQLFFFCARVHVKWDGKIDAEDMRPRGLAISQVIVFVHEVSTSSGNLIGPLCVPVTLSHDQRLLVDRMGVTTFLV